MKYLNYPERVAIPVKEYEKLWQKYQTEGIARNVTLQMFCSMNNVPYNSFEKYLKTRRGMSDIHPVSITDLPAEEVKDQAVEDKATDAPSSEKACDNGSRTRILVSLRMNNVPYFLISDKKL